MLHVKKFIVLTLIAGGVCDATIQGGNSKNLRTTAAERKLYGDSSVTETVEIVESEEDSGNKVEKNVIMKGSSNIIHFSTENYNNGYSKGSSSEDSNYSGGTYSPASASVRSPSRGRGKKHKRTRKPRPYRPGRPSMTPSSSPMEPVALVEPPTDWNGDAHTSAPTNWNGDSHLETPQPTTPIPTRRPSRRPTPLPTRRPSRRPTPLPTNEPTPEPTPLPTRRPSRRPTPLPTPEPTPEPTPLPTRRPSRRPTPLPTNAPTPEPTPLPTRRPSRRPTPLPTPEPTPEPTPLPTRRPSRRPTPLPTQSPIQAIVTPAPTSCEERFWHPNPDFTICSNDENYASDSPYLYSSLEICCQAIFGTSTCDYNDICTTWSGDAWQGDSWNGDAWSGDGQPIDFSGWEGDAFVETPQPTVDPTPQPSPRPTKKPTPSPTPEPSVLEPITSPEPTLIATPKPVASFLMFKDEDEEEEETSDSEGFRWHKDVDEKCETVTISDVCIVRCVVITSIFHGDVLIDESSQVVQDSCISKRQQAKQDD